MTHHCTLIAGLVALLSIGQPSQDYTNVTLAELGVKPVLPMKDAKTGFLVAGKNDTALIKKLTEINGQSIADLEKAMRPGQLSRAGFLGKEERLLDVLAADNKYVVDELGLTHQELARHLHVLGAIGKRETKEFKYHGRRFKIELLAARGFQESPFDDGTRSNTNAKLANLDNGKTLAYSLLVPVMVERYGFYEGKGTPYRVEPRQILAVLDFLQPKAKAKE